MIAPTFPANLPDDDDPAFPPEPAPPPAPLACAFWLAGACFCIDVAVVREVAELARVLALPRTPALVLGLAPLRGAAVAVVDLAGVLDVTGQRPPAAGRALVLDLPDDGAVLRIAVPVERVEGVFPRDGSLAPPALAHDWSLGVQEFSRRPGLVATVIDPDALAARAARLRPRRGTLSPALTP
jgi:chemotaxis signal transduction protein